MIKAFIEIPAGSYNKYELDKTTGELVVDRVLNQPIPANYGFIPDTLAEDNDPLDVFVITEVPLESGREYYITLLGIMYCKDSGVNDHKLLAILKNDDVSARKHFEDIERYLDTYKLDFDYQYMASCRYAKKELTSCKKRFENEISTRI